MAARGVVWSEDETFELISLWGDDHIQALLEGARHNHSVYTKLAEQLASKGHEPRGGKQCQDKIRKLKLKYRAILDHNNKSGRALKRWAFFEKMNEILGTRPTSRPTILLESTIEPRDDTEDHVSDDEVDSNSIGLIIESDEVENHAHGRHGTPNSTGSSEFEVADMDSDNLQNKLFDKAKTSTPVPKQRKYETVHKKNQKKSKIEKALDSTINTFTMAWKEMDGTYLEMEKQRQRKEEEMELKRLQAEENMREKDRNHELKIMHMYLNFMSQMSTVQQQHNQGTSFTHPDSMHMGSSYWSL